MCIQVRMIAAQEGEHPLHIYCKQHVHVTWCVATCGEWFSLPAQFFLFLFLFRTVCARDVVCRNTWLKPCRNMWHHVAPCGTMWHYVATRGTMWHHVAPCGTMWQHVAATCAATCGCNMCRNTWHHVAPCGTMWLHHVATCGTMWLHHVAAPCGCNMWLQPCNARQEGLLLVNRVLVCLHREMAVNYLQGWVTTAQNKGKMV
jgi:hypothetical protein